MARINGEIVLLEEFEAFSRLRIVQDGPVSGRPDRASLLNDFITEVLLEQEARRTGLEISQEELDEKLAIWFGEDADQRSALGHHVKRFITIQKLLHRRVGAEAVVTLEEVQDYYSRNEFLAQERVRVLEILVEDRPTAERLRLEVQPGDVRGFQEAAKKYSQGATAQEGGDIGTFERGQLPEEFERTVFSLRAGQVSEVFHSTHGYHFFMVSERIRKHFQKLYEVQKDIFEDLMVQKERQALDGFLKQITGNASIEILDETLRDEWRLRNAEAGG